MDDRVFFNDYNTMGFVYIEHRGRRGILWVGWNDLFDELTTRKRGGLAIHRNDVTGYVAVDGNSARFNNDGTVRIAGEDVRIIDMVYKIDWHSD